MINDDILLCEKADGLPDLRQELILFSFFFYSPSLERSFVKFYQPGYLESGIIRNSLFQYQLVSATRPIHHDGYLRFHSAVRLVNPSQYSPRILPSGQRTWRLQGASGIASIGNELKTPFHLRIESNICTDLWFSVYRRSLGPRSASRIDLW